MERAAAVVDSDFVVSAVERLASATSSRNVMEAFNAAVQEIFGDRAVLVADEPPTVDDSGLGRAARAAWETRAAVRMQDVLAVMGAGGSAHPIVIAVSPPADEVRQVLVAEIVARLLSARPRRAATAADGSVCDQLQALDREASSAGKYVVVGLVDLLPDPAQSPAQVATQRDRLRYRLRKILRAQDRIYDWGHQLLVAQVLPRPTSGLLLERLWTAVRAVNAEEGATWRVVDAWVSAHGAGSTAAIDRVRRAEHGLARMAELRAAGLATLQGAPGEQAFADLTSPATAVIVVDAQRMIRGVNEAGMAFFPEAQSDVARESLPDPADSVDTDQLTFHNPDGSVLADDDLPGVRAMNTGFSGQDRLIGIRFRNFNIHWVLLAGVSASDDMGRAVGYVASMTPADDNSPEVRARLRDALDLVDDPVVVLAPHTDDEGEIVDFVVTEVNAAALTALGRPETLVVGALESDLNPSQGRLGLMLNYAEVIRTGRSTSQTISIPDGPVMGSYRVTAEPFGSGVLVVAHSLANGQREQGAKLWDNLTGLASRQALLSRLNELQRSQHEAVTLVMCDIDDFTGVNDSLGRLRSDRYLVEVGRLLSRMAGPYDLVARVGSDEFAVLSTSPRSPQAAQELAETVRRAMRSGVSVGERQFTAAASVGVIWAPPSIATSDLLNGADMAMYRSKVAGGDRVTVSRGRGAGEGSLEIESQLRTALADEQFVMHYQPIVDLRDGRVKGVEALIRWRHPSGGLTSPAKFIPVAERRHLMVDIGLLILDQVCDQMRVWQAALGHPVRVSMNVSTAQLVRPGLATAIARRTAENGINPDCLQLEITESQLLNADRATLGNLRACREVGCELAIDDFGTGHAGFDYLRRIPAQILKIDKTFIDGLGVDGTDGAIVSGVVALGHGLGLVVVAEGVERQVQADALRTLGCDAAQGWLWAPAMDPADVLPILRSEHVTP